MHCLQLVYNTWHIALRKVANHIAKDAILHDRLIHIAKRL